MEKAMKKKLGKRLTLNRETLRNLSERAMAEAAGAVTGPCNPSGDETLLVSDCIQVTCRQGCVTLPIAGC